MNDRSQSETEPDHLIRPGARIGMVGGGQLGRMFAVAAASMGYIVRVFCESDSEPAAQVAAECVTGSLDDPACVERFAKDCDVITLEFENIPAPTIQGCADHAPTYPSASVLRTAQDRWLEKTTLQQAGLQVTPFAAVADAEQTRAFASEYGYPIIVKTARSGYDGKGQYRVRNGSDADTIPWDSVDASEGPAWIAEQCIEFDREVSVVVARKANGDQAAFPPFENEHANHILDVTRCPANIDVELSERVQEIGNRVAESLHLVGLVCVELFVCQDEVLINEIAPRPHNSGHLSIEACATSQFEQHVRAICGLPLGDTRLVVGGAAMSNLLGDLWEGGRSPRWDRTLAESGIRLHLYGKAAAKPGRKMGHLTCVSDSVVDAVAKVRRARTASQNSVASPAASGVPQELAD